MRAKDYIVFLALDLILAMATAFIQLRLPLL
jgi:hypothetical protein